MGEKWAVDDRHQLDDRTNAKLDELLAPDEAVRVIIRFGGSLIATDRRVLLFRRNHQMGGLFHGDVMASWDLAELTGVLFEQKVNYGYVAVVGPGLQDPQVMLQLRPKKEPPGRELALPNVQQVQGTKLPLTSRLDPADLAQRVVLIRGLVSGAKAPQPAPSSMPDPMDQLRKLAQLRDEGVITAAEFETKKSELLSRM